MSLLSFREVAKSYGVVPVLKGIDLAIEPGEVLALVGENGAGKSTLMRIAAGLAGASAGTVRRRPQRCKTPSVPASSWCIRNSAWRRT